MIPIRKQIINNKQKGLSKKCTAPQKLDTKLLGCFL